MDRRKPGAAAASAMARPPAFRLLCIQKFRGRKESREYSQSERSFHEKRSPRGAMLIAVTWSVGHSAPALAQRPPGMSPSAWDPLKSDLRNPQIEIVYEEPKNPTLR